MTLEIEVMFERFAALNQLGLLIMAADQILGDGEILAGAFSIDGVEVK